MAQPTMNRQMRSSEFDQMNQVGPDGEIQAANVAKCPHCGMSWLELVKMRQFNRDFQVILGQEPAQAGPDVFYILRCVKCGELIEPNVMLSSQDLRRKAYDRFLDEVEAKMADQ
jgi:DNA-directed RNA polymerase subunit RPC12/RpoP